MVQVNHPAKFDLVRLDYVETSGLAPYVPPLQEHGLRTALEPSTLAAADDAIAPSVVRQSLEFDGA